MSELDTSCNDGEKSGTSGFCGFTVGRVIEHRATMKWMMKAEGQHGTLGEDWASSCCRSVSIL